MKFDLEMQHSKLFTQVLKWTTRGQTTLNAENQLGLMSLGFSSASCSQCVCSQLLGTQREHVKESIILCMTLKKRVFDTSHQHFVMTE